MLNIRGITLDLVRELKMRCIKAQLRFSNILVEIDKATDAELYNIVYNNTVQAIYVDTPHGKESINALAFRYCFDTDSLIINYKNGRMKVISLYN